VYKFDIEEYVLRPTETGPSANSRQCPPAVHLSDLVSLFTVLVTRILQHEDIPSGEQGYYFGFNHRSPFWAMLDRIAVALHKRGLVPTSETKSYPSHKSGADSLGFPEQFISAMCMSSGDLVAVNGYKLGWQPKWDEKRYLDHMDEEV
jgi:hypothetical protein